ncbi:DUF3311 domain-containing protein [Actinoplanes bogorensis]|uniref:DUF3311 domain-containing protein n=2 Tax=Paractinoplanes bogorensis TaxID=1610840 RepID=A0ABS5Z1Z4_9ACTN|nr:DUF3311 domain-containing protein [Actinoplanes bogorensis]
MKAALRGRAQVVPAREHREPRDQPIPPPAAGWSVARHRSGEWATVRDRRARRFAFGEQREDRSRWHWLLLIPIVLPLMPVLYNRVDPALLGMPFFYWCQLAFAFLASGTIAFVHRKTR